MRMQARWTVLAMTTWMGLAGCKHAVELYCDQDTPCLPRYPDQPYCDVDGTYPESNGIGHTCIGFPDDPTKDFCLADGDCPAADPICGPDLICRGCESNQECLDLGEIAGTTFCAGDGACLACEPDAFFRCDVNQTGDPVLVACAGDGSGEVERVCGDSCDAANQRCRDCAPSTNACVGGPGFNDWQYVVCDSSGNETSRTDCYVGCSDDGVATDGCLDLDPLNGLATYLDMTDTAPDVVVAAGTTLIIDTGSRTFFTNDGPISVPSTDALPSITFMVGSLDVGDVVVQGSTPLAIVSNGDIVIRGHFSVSAAGPQPGPGADPTTGPGTCAGQPGQVGASDVGNSGSGGGSFAGAGGRGGHVMNGGVAVIDGGAAGQQVVDANFDLEPLLGGCSGGALVPVALWGGGGGAVQLVSRTRIRLEAGIVSANGGGGGGGPSATVSEVSPGGGSGGGILLEAPVIEATTGAGLYAHGGGGCIGTGAGIPVNPGQDGPLSEASAIGASCTLMSGVTLKAGDGDPPGGAGGDDASQGTLVIAPGGGGGAGFIELDDLAGAAAPANATIFPTPSPKTARTRPQT